MTDRTDERRSDDSSESDSFQYPDDTTDDPSESTTPPPTREPGTARKDGSPGRRGGGSSWLQRLRTAESGPLLYARDFITSVLIVLALGAMLFAISGVWPPMVAVESGSMEPNMERGDLVFVVDNDRFTPETAPTSDGRSTGVVPADVAQRNGQTEFDRPGDVIVFQPNGNTGRTPVIHRAMLWVDAGENWYDRADPDAIGGADNCIELDHCPAPHPGFITQGDNERTNTQYDQVTRLSAPVRPGWIVGTAELRVPYLGHIRLILSPAAIADEPRVNAGYGTPAGHDRTAA